MIFEVEQTPPRHVYNLLIGLVAPRPIALVTTRDPQGRLNAAPFSAYNYLSIDPPIVALGIAARPESKETLVLKDTARNIRDTREFVVNVVTEDIAAAMNLCGTDFPPHENELDAAGLETTPSSTISVPRIRSARAALECREHTTLCVGRSNIVLGQVLAMYIDDAFVDPAGPYVKAEELHAIGRMNGQGAYVRTQGAFFHMPRIPYEHWKQGQRE